MRREWEAGLPVTQDPGTALVVSAVESLVCDGKEFAVVIDELLETEVHAEGVIRPVGALVPGALEAAGVCGADADEESRFYGNYARHGFMCCCFVLFVGGG